MGPFKTRIRRPFATPQLTYLGGDLAKRYGFPTITPTTPIVGGIGIIELGGGWSSADLNAYCAAQGIRTPSVVDVPIAGGSDQFTGDPNSADGEQALDVQVVAGATGGQITIRVYQCPNTDQGFAAGVAQASKDNLSALSISWGAIESAWSAGARSAFDAALQACLAANCSVFASSGDDGSTDGGNGNNVDYPASSPYCIGCGGTTIGSVESAWSSGGGGLSKLYAKPAWQAIGGTARGVPDVSANADPASGYKVVVGGKWYVFGGTSAVAPLMAAMKALCDCKAGKRLPWIGPTMYTAGNLTDILTGSNGAFRAGPGWDPASGLGVPNAAFCAALIASGGGVVVPPDPPPTTPVTVQIPFAGKWTYTP